MSEKNEIDRAGQVEKGTGRTRQPERTTAQTSENIFGRQLAVDARASIHRSWHTGVMPAESMQPVRIRGSDHRFVKFLCQRGRAAVWIQESFVKMTKLDRVEAIDLRNQTIAD